MQSPSRNRSGLLKYGLRLATRGPWIASAVLFPQALWAQSCTASFSNVAFGLIDVLPGAQFDSAGTLSASCTGITGSRRVLLCFDLNSGSFPYSGAWRQMGAGANRLLFNMYSDPGRSNVWNTTTAGLISVVLSRTAPSAVVSTYARVPGGQQTVPPGSYTTTMTSLGGGIVYTGTSPGCGSVARTASFNFNVSATVTPACTVSASNMVFNNISFFKTNLDATSAISVTCTSGTPYHVRLDGGTTGATDPTQRKMSSGANQVIYGLYRDSARSLPWGSTDGVNTATGTGTATAFGHTVYGRIPPQPSVPPATYMDTIVVTVAF